MFFGEKQRTKECYENSSFVVSCSFEKKIKFILRDLA